MLRSFLVLGLILISFSAPAFSADCSVPRIPTLDNQTVDGTMTVKAGKRCTIRLLASSGPMFSVDVVQKPANGTVTTSISSVRDTPKPGFTGTDSFTYARKGFTKLNQPSVKTVRIAVTVVP
jgi:Bacterial Ig domain